MQMFDPHASGVDDVLDHLSPCLWAFVVSPGYFDQLNPLYLRRGDQALQAAANKLAGFLCINAYYGWASVWMHRKVGTEHQKSIQKNIFLFSKETGFAIATKYFFASLKYGPPSPCRNNAE